MMDILNMNECRQHFKTIKNTEKSVHNFENTKLTEEISADVLRNVLYGRWCGPSSGHPKINIPIPGEFL